MIEDSKVTGLLAKYFVHLEHMGYVNQHTMSKYMLYLFLYDFADSMYDFISDKDYLTINKLLRALFATGGCLLPYELFGQFGYLKATLGSNKYMGAFGPRITEDREHPRMTEDDNVRFV